jgi:hypothetical protein
MIPFIWNIDRLIREEGAPKNIQRQLGLVVEEKPSITDEPRWKNLRPFDLK